jgi:hypothetical protein
MLIEKKEKKELKGNNNNNNKKRIIIKKTPQATSHKPFINVKNLPKKYLTFLGNRSDQEESSQKASCFYLHCFLQSQRYSQQCKHIPEMQESYSWGKCLFKQSHM